MLLLKQVMIPVMLLPLRVHGGWSKCHWIVEAKITGCWFEQAEGRGKERSRKGVNQCIVASKRQCRTVMELSDIVRGLILKGVVSCKGNARMSLKKLTKNWLGPSIIKVDEQERQLKAQTGFFVAQGETGCLSPRPQGKKLASEDDGRRRTPG